MRRALSCLTLFHPMDCSSPGSAVHGDSPAKNTGVGCYFLLQGIFPTQGLNSCVLCLLHGQAGSLPLVPLGCPLQIMGLRTSLVIQWLRTCHANAWDVDLISGTKIPCAMGQLSPRVTTTEDCTPQLESPRVTTKDLT